MVFCLKVANMSNVQIKLIQLCLTRQEHLHGKPEVTYFEGDKDTLTLVASVKITLNTHLLLQLLTTPNNTKLTW